MAKTKLQEAVQEALARKRAAEEERQEHFGGVKAAAEARIAARKQEEAKRHDAAKATLDERLTRQQEAEYARLKAQYRANFRGPDEAFEQVWPDVLARIIAAQPTQRVTRL